MPTLAPPQLEVRSVEVRAAAAGDGAREFSGIAVPYNDPVTIRSWYGNYSEQIAPGAVEHEDDVKVFWRHGEVIGRITAGTDTDRGWEVTGVLSDTTLGRDAYALLRDGAIDRMSIGFEPIEHTEREDDDGLHITRTRIRVREVSLVPFPAYDGAAVEQVRSKEESEKPTMPAPVTDDRPAVEVRQIIEELDRKVDTITARLDEQTTGHRSDMPAITFRSRGELLKAIASGSTDAVREYNEVSEWMARDWNPAGTGTTGAVALDGWVGDMTRLYPGNAGVISHFATGALPASGMNIEYGVLKSNTIQVTKQATEGATLAFGKVETEAKTAPVGTYGGYSRLSKQVVQRSSINHVNLVTRGLDLAAGNALKAAFATLYDTTWDAAVTAGGSKVIALPGAAATVSAATVDDWIDVVVDGAVKFDAFGLPMSEVELLLDKTVFKALAKLEDDSGRKILNVYGTGVNQVGSMNLPGLSGNLAGIRVALAADWTPTAGTGAAFVHPEAIRTYTNPLAQLTDDDITTLTNDYSVYRYAAFAPEVPDFIVPVVPAG